MYSDDEQTSFGGGGGGGGGGRGSSRSPERRGGGGGSHEDRRRSRSRSRDKGKGKAKGKGDGKGKQRTSGRELPKLNSVHKSSVVSIQSYGAFVRLGDGSTYKDGLLHVSRISASGRIEAVADILSEGDAIWVKVCEVNDDAQKFSVDMRYVRQKDGEDLDPNNTSAEMGKGAKGGGKGPEPIRIGAVQATTCSKCGAKGHMARECWAGGGKNYDLVDEVPEAETGAARPSEAVPGVDPKIVKAALDAYMKRKAVGDSPDTRRQSKKDKKEQKKEKKLEKKEKKKAKKEAKKSKKKDKKGKKEKKGKSDSKSGAGKKAEAGSLAALLADVSSDSSSSSS